ncbi:MAG: P-loop NTPase [Lachnospiraceae bacterium]|nr:P-loop NTPase [Lachnospiraceae bacterium]
MSEEKIEATASCSGDCSGCSSACSSRKPSKEDLLEPMNAYSNVKHVIGIVSGKGGVGKSFITSYLSVLFNRRGYNTAILDADVTGPSIPKAFGLHEKAMADEMGIIPELTKEKIEVMSVNLLLDNEASPVLWRGALLASTVKQFWNQVVWGDVDYMFVDMPPGTGDVPLTVFQSLPLDGIIIVTSPQDLVSMIVTKAVHMANMMQVPVLGLVENYSYVECPDCGKHIEVFGHSHIDEISVKFELPVLAKLPIDSKIAAAVDAGEVESLEGDWLDYMADILSETFPVEKSNERKELRIAVATDEKGNVDGHFGKAKLFTVYNIKEDKLTGKESLTCDGNGHEGAVKLMKEAGITAVLCGGIGEEAMSELMKAGIMVVPGASGDIDVVVSTFLDGSLFGGGSVNDEPTCSCGCSSSSCGCGGESNADCGCGSENGCNCGEGRKN